MRWRLAGLLLCAAACYQPRASESAAAVGPSLPDAGPADAGIGVACGDAACAPGQACVLPCCLGDCRRGPDGGCPPSTLPVACFPFLVDAATCQAGCMPAPPTCVSGPGDCSACDSKTCVHQGPGTIMCLCGHP